MNELIKVSQQVIGNETVNGVSARELYEFLEIDTAFTTWMNRMIDYGFSNGIDFIPFLKESNGGRPSTEYAITLDMAKEISMIQRSEKGKQARKYFIQCEKKLKESVMDTSQLSPQMQMFKAMFDATAKIEISQLQIKEDIDDIKEENMILKQKNKTIENRLNNVFNVNIEDSDSKLLCKYIKRYAYQEKISIPDAWHIFDSKFENAYKISLPIRRSKHKEMNKEGDMVKTKISRPKKLAELGLLKEAIRVVDVMINGGM